MTNSEADDDAASDISENIKEDNIDPKIVSRLPRIPKTVKFQDAQFIGSGLHSRVYSASTTYKNKTITAALKVFSAMWKENFEREVQAYEFLTHFSVSGVVPAAYGYIDNWTHDQFLVEVLDDSPSDNPESPPVYVLMLEYIGGAVQLSGDNIDWRICKEVLRGLYLIHSAQVLQRDIAERNILIVPSTGRVVWIDFSICWVNPYLGESWTESNLAQSILYHRLVIWFPSWG
jgi:serine/threonine protein kinase